MTLYTIVGTNQPARVIAAGDGPGVLVNRDLTNQVFIGPDAGFNPGDVTASILDPLVGIPFDGDEDVYACTASGASVQVDYIQNALDWTPSPGQAAAQLAAIEANTANTVSAVNNPSYGPSTLVQQEIAADAELSRQNLEPNPYFANGSGAGWTARNGATLAFVTTQPAGGPRQYACEITPNGTFTTPGINKPGSGNIQCSPGQIFGIRLWYYCFALTNTGEFPEILVLWYNSTGGLITSTAVAQFATTGLWIHGSGIFVAPANAVSFGYGLSINGNGVNVPVTDIAYVEDLTVHSGIVPGVAATANDIANTGAPLLALAQQIESLTNQALTAGTPLTLGPFSINQIGYEGSLAVGNAIVASTTTITCTVEWLEGSTVIDFQNYNFFTGGNSLATAHNIFFKGPTRASSVQFTFTASVNNATLFAFSLFQHSRICAFDFWRTYTGQPAAIIAAGPFLAGYDVAANLVATQLPTNVNSGNTRTLILPLYTGKCTLDASTNSGAADLHVFIQSLAEPSPNNDYQVYNEFSNAKGGLDVQDIFLGRSQCQISLTNTNAAAANVGMTLVGADY